MEKKKKSRGTIPLKGLSSEMQKKSRGTIPLKGLSSEMQGKVGRKWAQTMRIDELYNRFASVFLFKETPSQEKLKTSFGI
jgi:hypothetical protein